MDIGNIIPVYNRERRSPTYRSLPRSSGVYYGILNMEETTSMIKAGRSSKAKGRRLQNLVRDKLREKFTSLEEDDIKSAIMGTVGEDIVLSPAARKVIPFSFECKNVERLQFWKTVEQAEGNSNGRTPVIVVKKNGRKPYIALPLDDWLELIS
tara:strand:+ start:412 stop:870 length:459 start_codon:yes stop_codon:yes gene_type:complete